VPDQVGLGHEELEAGRPAKAKRLRCARNPSRLTQSLAGVPEPTATWLLWAFFLRLFFSKNQPTESWLAAMKFLKMRRFR
jgi:hypothetical protein